MEAFMEQFVDLKIQLEEIISATNNFHKNNFIGGGGFGKVYKGELSMEKSTVAFKRLDRRYGQGEPEFLKEITMLSLYRHENVISLLGFCNEGDEMILAYEHASNGSLDRHLDSPSLTWTHRLKICLQAAKGLSYLHDPKGTHQRVIHRDIKSANILLDDQWCAKVSDFGLSKIGPANEQYSYIVTAATGTLGYCDPVYWKTYTVTKESDVYSFGVVLFEVLCGRLCYTSSSGELKVFVPMWKEKYEQHRLDEIIFQDLKQQMDATSLEIFTDIAYECLRESRTERPTMSRVVEKLDIALQVQEATPDSSNSGEFENKQKPQMSRNELPQENQDLLIKCIKQDLGFSNGKPVAACLIYNSLLHWRLFEAHSTTTFERITQTITLATKDSNHALEYWLCNTCTLVTLLTRTFKATPQRPFLSRRTNDLRQVEADDLRQVEAEYPALLFRSQLTDLLMKIYGMIRDNLKKELSPLLDLCIRGPGTSSEALVEGRSHVNAVAHWQPIVKYIDSHFKTMKANFVAPFLVRKVFTQIFSFINVQLFNSLLSRRECCSFVNGEYAKAGLAELEQWCANATEEYAGSAWLELNCIRQAVTFLVIRQKPNLTLEEFTEELCPVLSLPQLYRISTMYWDDKYGTRTVSSEVISSMRVMITEYLNNGGSSSFLLEDDTSIPFGVDEILRSMPHVDTGNIELPSLIRENSGFAFLHQRTE